MKEKGKKDKPLAGNYALITGCSRKEGIGFATASRLGAMGADLFIHSYRAYDRTMPWGEGKVNQKELIGELKETGAQVEHMDLDLSLPDAPARLISRAIEKHKPPDLLIVNHTYSTMGGLEELTADEIDKHLHINLRATLLLVKEFAGALAPQTPGRIIFLTSGQHLHPMPGELAYITSKGGLHPLCTSLAAHLAPRGITVNTVNPGATDTGYADPPLYRHILEMEPQGRWGMPEDAARLIGWLCSPEGQWVTGQVINSTGGGP